MKEVDFFERALTSAACSKCLLGHVKGQWYYRAQLFNFRNKKQTLKEGGRSL